MRTRKPANPRRLAETAWRHSSSRSRRNIFMFGFLSDARVVLQFLGVMPQDWKAR